MIDVRVRFQIIGNARIENAGKYQSCMVSELPIILWKDRTKVRWRSGGSRSPSTLQSSAVVASLLPARNCWLSPSRANVRSLQGQTDTQTDRQAGRRAGRQTMTMTMTTMMMMTMTMMMMRRRMRRRRRRRRRREHRAAAALTNRPVESAARPPQTPTDSARPLAPGHATQPKMWRLLFCL
eukprot:COSAG05_NODE_1903_length_3854_cov_12.540613_3_plen_181_part_00